MTPSIEPGLLISTPEKPHVTKTVLFSVITILFFAAFYKSTLAMFAHGFTWHFVIPILSGYIIWIFRKDYFNHRMKPSPVLGTILLISAFVMLFIGNATSTLVISELAIVFGIWGVVIYLGGLRLFKKISWPLLYLLFISSVTEGLFDLFTPIFRQMSAVLAVLIAHIAGYTILLSETYIRLPFMTLNVADECSGVNHLISLVAITLPLAFLTQRKRWSIALLSLSAVPIALFSNSLRVLILVIYNYNRTVFTHGPHNFFVTSTGFFIGLILVFSLASFLSRFISKPSISNTSEQSDNSNKQTQPPLNFKLIVFLTIILFVGAVFPWAWKIQDNLTLPDFNKLNTSIPGWNNQQISSIPGLDSLPSPDSECRFQFTNSTKDPFYLYIGWYANQLQGREVAGFLYDKSLKQFSSISIKLDNKSNFKFRLCQPKRSLTGFSYLVIYRSENRYTSVPIKTKLYAATDALLHKTTSASIIIIAVPEHTSDNLISTGKQEQFVKDIFPFIEKCF
jgi:exosortase